MLQIFFVMAGFTGTYDCMIDNKGRVIIPAPLKRQLLPFAEEKFIVKQSIFKMCLELYVMEEWNRQLVMMDELSPFDEESNDFIRVFFDGIKEVEMDTTGRILLTKDLLSYSKISKDVKMASRGDIIEIWDLALYEKTVENTKRDKDKFKELAQKVMKNVKKPNRQVPSGYSSVTYS